MLSVSQQEQGPSATLVELAADIVSAYVSKNSVPVAELPNLIASVHISLTNRGRVVSEQPEKPVPLMPIKKTVTPDYLISLEDGRQYKSLKRHLSTRGLTPEEYRRKWGLPHDYPMVAATYAAQRSELAKNSGLGRPRKAA
ncbi:MucR family transcriptional regulator [Methylobacterium frigidaeris]|uniref:Transcriptional regulatory protein ros n=1 Tax=Methylobacterium frigidaeris TaxID=2038277 RepID=A0AA37HJU3_9HYPH|nr:MucR family transcriptional regulator [Methylobacterium frigidaeris]PIK70214.1 MucR family transcriptional regulator [Methylobacterium frigidaeris]GJD66934.1 Transcriptional regulatory protein ros [Methylobacterium frigidaeris]